MAIDVVWFKRDLRTRDHVPLLSAILSGRPVLCLFILEPERFKQVERMALVKAILQEPEKMHVE